MRNAFTSLSSQSSSALQPDVKEKTWETEKRREKKKQRKIKRLKKNNKAKECRWWCVSFPYINYNINFVFIWVLLGATIWLFIRPYPPEFQSVVSFHRLVGSRSVKQTFEGQHGASVGLLGPVFHLMLRLKIGDTLGPRQICSLTDRITSCTWGMTSTVYEKGREKKKPEAALKFFFSVVVLIFLVACTQLYTLPFRSVGR